MCLTVQLQSYITSEQVTTQEHVIQSIFMHKHISFTVTCG